MQVALMIINAQLERLRFGVQIGVQMVYAEYLF